MTNTQVNQKEHFLQWLEKAQARARALMVIEIKKDDANDTAWKYQMVGYYNAYVDVVRDYKSYLEAHKAEKIGELN